jgi:hypothetical protein
LTVISSDRGLISRIYKELKKKNPHQNNNVINKWANELNGHFSTEEVQMAKKKLHEKNVQYL